MSYYSFSGIFLALQPVCPDTKYTRENTNKDKARKIRKETFILYNTSKSKISVKPCDQGNGQK